MCICTPNGVYYYPHRQIDKTFLWKLNKCSEGILYNQITNIYRREKEELLLYCG